MTIWPKDTMKDKIAFYGNPSLKGFEDKYLVPVVAPFEMYYDKHPIKSFRAHKLCVSALLAAFNEITDKCGHDQKKIDAAGASDYGGCYNPRKIAGSNSLSNHSFGCAIDLSPGTNGFRTGKGTISSIVVDAFKRQGARWGGDYKGRTDPMHFEFVTPV